MKINIKKEFYNPQAINSVSCFGCKKAKKRYKSCCFAFFFILSQGNSISIENRFLQPITSWQKTR